MLKLNNVMLGSDEPEKLVEFYASVFGPSPWSDAGFTGWDLGGVYLMVGGHSDVKGRNESPGRIMFSVQTESFQKEFDRIKAAGATVSHEPYQPGVDQAPDFWMATFEDTDGNYFQLMSPPPQM